MNYYNEFDPNAAAWLRALIAEGLIPPGVVDERSITDVLPTDLLGFTQCHFFAGIGGWPLAFALAEWPEDEPAWTMSCPCQPFSTAGKQMGRKDPRHLWPSARRLINRCGPPIVFGEQVASADGRKWLAGVFSNLETMGYAPAGVDLCAAGVGAPHIRQRLYWVADACGDRRSQGGGADRSTPRTRLPGSEPESIGLPHRMGNANDEGSQRYDRHGNDGDQPGRLGAEPVGSTGETSRLVSGMADSTRVGRGQRSEDVGRSGERGSAERLEQRIGSGGFWSDSHPILCRDGKRRRIPTEPGLFPLADGLPYKLARRGSIRPALLKGSGNAIVPEAAAEFIRAFRETRLNAIQ